MSLAEQADALHHPWLLPFEWVDLCPHLSQPEWGVVLEDGNVLRSCGRWRYLIVARVNGTEHVLAANPADRLAGQKFLAQTDEPRAAWLLRLDTEIMVLRGPEAIEARRTVDQGIALLLDYGKVLCHFDYAWFSWGHAAVFGVEPAPDALLELEALRPAFESGDLGENDFLAAAFRHLGLIDADRKLFEAAWANILRLNDDMVALARRAKNLPGWSIAIASNIDPILIRQSMIRFDLGDLFEGGVFSYASDVRPKHQDASMWRLAEQNCARQLGGEAQLAIAIDDTPANLLTAAAEPAVDYTLQFRNPWQWWYEMGAAGAYLPRQAMATPNASLQPPLRIQIPPGDRRG
jgi:FMN phosphatase YigB (HAD superfamily)